MNILQKCSWLLIAPMTLSLLTIPFVPESLARSLSQKWWCRSPVIEYRISADNIYRSREVLGERILGKGTTQVSARQDLKQKCDQFQRFDSSIKVGRKCGYATRCGTD